MNKSNWLFLILIGALLVSPVILAHILSNFTSLLNGHVEIDPISINHIYELLFVRG
ncbi:hypothetical protein KI655_04345 [Vibrio sp. D404a]|uniref:hypothetical protein n=1 Tax=unclassified Vibrio TaxID=2614977 RepID=UPI00255225D8|nr:MULTISPECIES: hypothetical protein [unclassified Vibrio]MDK9736522.1 hypothetical protein [Vibrio sp. D404a]MDK9796831.1 hypothetical protein [Vibrio sp. D449a]